MSPLLPLAWWRPAIFHPRKTFLTNSGRCYADSEYGFKSHPAEMTDKEWNVVMVTNSLLHGMYLDMKTFTFRKAGYPGMFHLLVLLDLR
jgi:hypothetical protein